MALEWVLLAACGGPALEQILLRRTAAPGDPTLEQRISVRRRERQRETTTH